MADAPEKQGEPIVPGFDLKQLENIIVEIPGRAYEGGKKNKRKRSVKTKDATLALNGPEEQNHQEKPDNRRKRSGSGRPRQSPTGNQERTAVVKPGATSEESQETSTSVKSQETSTSVKSPSLSSEQPTHVKDNRKKAAKKKKSRETLSNDSSDAASARGKDNIQLKKKDFPEVTFGKTPKEIIGELNEEEPGEELLSIFAKDHMYPLKEKSSKFPLAKYHCQACDYHCDTVVVCQRHVKDKKHKRMVLALEEEEALRNLPPLSKVHIKVLDALLLNIIEQQGLTAQEIETRYNIVKNLNAVISADIKGCQFHLFGSSSNGFALRHSDVNIDIEIEKGIQTSKVLLQLLDILKKSYSYSKVVSHFTVKIPSIHFVDKKSGLRCIITYVETDASRQTSRLLSLYCEIDPRVRTLGIVLRYWGKLCHIDKQDMGSLPSHAFPLMVIYYLQQCQPPVLPVLHSLISKGETERSKLLGNDSMYSYFDDLSQLSNVWKCKNESSVGVLWVGLFRFYALEFNMNDIVVCIKQSTPMAKELKKWSTKKITIEDPFMPKRNLARCVNSQLVFEYIQDRLRDALRFFSLPPTTTSNKQSSAKAKRSRPQPASNASHKTHQPIDTTSADVNNTLLPDTFTKPGATDQVNTAAINDDSAILHCIMSSQTWDSSVNNVITDKPCTTLENTSTPHDAVVVTTSLANSGDDSQIPELKQNLESLRIDSVPLNCPVTTEENNVDIVHEEHSISTSNVQSRDHSDGNYVDVDVVVDADLVEEVEEEEVDSPKEVILSLLNEVLDETFEELEGDLGEEEMEDDKMEETRRVSSKEELDEDDWDDVSADDEKSASELEEEKTRDVFVLIEDETGAKLRLGFNQIALTGGGKIPTVVCNECKREGHMKDDCPDDKTPVLQALPRMMPDFILRLNKLCLEMPGTHAPSDREVQNRNNVLRDLERYIRTQFDDDAQLCLFGSSINCFGFKQSDLDICMTFRGVDTTEDLETPVPEIIESLAAKLKRYNAVYNVIPIPTAKVPIVKFVHRRTQLEADISLYNTLAQHNTRMLAAYANIDVRVQQLGYTIKVFAKRCDIGDASRGSLSSYAYILMMLYFLQQRKPPVIPVLQELYKGETKPETLVDGCNAWFYDDIKNLNKVWPEYGTNTESVGELWIGLLRFYTEEFKFKEHVISIRQKQLLTRFEKMWTSKCLAIEDPFDLSHNLGAGVSRKMNTYIMSAFQRGRTRFGTPVKEFHSDWDYFFDIRYLTNGTGPPNDRGCRICGKIGHYMKDCPRRRKKSGERKENESNRDDVDGDTRDDSKSEQKKVMEKQRNRSGHMKHSQQQQQQYHHHQRVQQPNKGQGRQQSDNQYTGVSLFQNLPYRPTRHQSGGNEGYQYMYTQSAPQSIPQPLYYANSTRNDRYDDSSVSPPAMSISPHSPGRGQQQPQYILHAQPTTPPFSTGNNQAFEDSPRHYDRQRSYNGGRTPGRQGYPRHFAWDESQTYVSPHPARGYQQYRSNNTGQNRSSSHYGRGGGGSSGGGGSGGGRGNQYFNQSKRF
ncbi:terminal uridylyltransferase 4-like [Saccoglossus kowalevskii]|uniref:Terminal uridylyltransferase 4-like n=1 Tax=Saccoglossus kowalevskii TaxID=10224 RepID=A0ABM0MWD9_SACKO|nr:PREDICTED: terminal uridylyltransferase 4-like [Saccoglossus kowalevskii]